MIRRFLLALSLSAVPAVATAHQTRPMVRGPFDTAEPDCKVARQVVDEIIKRSGRSVPVIHCNTKEITLVSMADTASPIEAWKVRRRQQWVANACQGETPRLTKAGWKFTQVLVSPDGQKFKVSATC